MLYNRWRNRHTTLPMKSLTEEQARTHLERLRWPNGVICPECGKAEVTKTNGGRAGLYQCRACRYQLTVTVGTIFEGSHIPLSKWVYAVTLVCASKKGISALQLSRMLHVTYKTAWFMSHRIRHAMQPFFRISKAVLRSMKPMSAGKSATTRANTAPDVARQTRRL